MGSHHRSFTLAIVAAVMFAGAVLANSSIAQARHTGHAVATAALRQLTRNGYRHIHMICTGRGDRVSCRWQGDRGRQRCRGVATAVHRKRRLTTIAIRHRICSAATSTPARPGTKHVSAPPLATKTSPKPPPVAQPAPARSAPAGANESDPELGFNTYTTARTVAEQRELGATVSRLFVDWALIEPSPGQWDWQSTDKAYSAMVAAGLTPLVVVYTAPCWARPRTDCSNAAFTGPPDPPYDDQWSAFVRAAAARYSAAVGVEVWNEPNLDQSFLPRANPTRFAELLAAAYHAIKSANAAMPVVSGGLLLSPAIAGTGQVTGGYGAPQFLAAMYAAGARSAMDALAVHIYPSDYVAGMPSRWDPTAMQAWLKLIGPARAAAGATGQPMWITEMGISTSTQAGWPAASTPSEQASDLGAMLAIARATPDIPYVIVHSLEDQTPGYDDPYNAINTGWGVFTDTGVAKPAACVISTAFHGSLSCP